MTIKDYLLYTCLLLAITFGYLYVHAHEQAQIEHANLLASQDTSRTYRTALEETSARLAYTSKINADSIRKLSASLGAALGKNHVLVVELQQAHVTIDSMVGSHVATTDTTVDSTRTLSTTLQGPPVAGSVSVRISPRASPLFSYDLHVSPIDMIYTLSCSRDRVPQVELTTPAWAHTSLSEGHVDPSVCSGVSSSWSLKSLIVGTGIGAGVYAIIYGILHG